MSQERAPISTREAPTQPSLFRKSLHALEQRRRDAAISFAATILAAVAMLANPSPTNHESQVDTAPATDNSPAGLVWGPDLTIAPERLREILLGVVLASAVGIAVGGTIYLDSRGRK